MASPSDPSVPDGSSDVVHTRSCHKCNQRKTRCSKTLPCTSCSKLGVECVFPPPGRAPRRKKRALKAELVSRVKYLENRLYDLGEERSHPQIPHSDHGDSHQEDISLASNDVSPSQSPKYDDMSKTRITSSTDRQFGQLIMDEEGKQYVEHEALIGFQNEVSHVFRSKESQY